MIAERNTIQHIWKEEVESERQEVVDKRGNDRVVQRLSGKKESGLLDVQCDFCQRRLI